MLAAALRAALRGRRPPAVTRAVTTRAPPSTAVTLEVRPGAGGAEATAFAGDLLRMYERAAARQGWAFRRTGDHTALVSGAGAAAALAGEAGVHAVKRVPSTEARGRVHTSTASVAVVLEGGEGGGASSSSRPPPLPAADVAIETFRSSGPGGQHANVTESAVRATHVPTGLQATSSSDRSQHRNRAAALAELARRVAAREGAAAAAARSAARAAQVGTGARAERVRTYALHRGVVIDHRSGAKMGQAEAVLSGERLCELWE
jgi:peptide chain release factor 1